MFSRAFARQASLAACRANTSPILVRPCIMPLRAKVLSHPRALMSTQPSLASPEILKPVEGDEPQDVVFNSLYGLRSIELNRPKKLNALNGSMIRKIGPRLLEWAKSDMANIIVIKGAGEKALCAGGDVAALARWNKEGPDGQKKSIDYFSLEYQLDHLIATYNKPCIAFMDGITMGGGVGLSMHAPLRIATERTVFAMPETTIGFFPDVGASFFLPRLPGFVGTYLALTSDNVTGADVYYSGLATHYLHSTSLPGLESRLAELRFGDWQDMEERLNIINATIEEFSTGLPYDQPMLLAGALRNAIDRCFKFDTIGDTISALNDERGNQALIGALRNKNGEPTTVGEWAERTIETIQKRSPTSVHVTLRQMRIARDWSIKTTFQREHQMAAKFMKKHDFTEGVTARLIERREPKWQPASLEDILPEEDISKPYFEVESEPVELELLTKVDYKEYKYNFGVPAEVDVEKTVSRGGWTKSKITKYYLEKTQAKQGVRDVIEEILGRKTRVNDEGHLVWLYQ